MCFSSGLVRTGKIEIGQLSFRSEEMVFVLRGAVTLALLNMAGKALFCMHKLYINVSVPTM